MKNRFINWLLSQHWLIERQHPLINVLLNEPHGELDKHWENKGEWRYGKKDFIKVDKNIE